MGGGPKALLELAGRPLLAHVRARLAPQVGTLLISGGDAGGGFGGLGLECVPDLLPGHRGPLTGLYSALQTLVDRNYAGSLVLCPCDAPFLPRDLVRSLLDQGEDKTRPLVAVSWQGVLQPTFSLWHVQHLPLVKEAVVERGIGGFKRLMSSMPHRILEWRVTEPPPFFNVNTPEDLETAAAWLDRIRT